HVRPVTELVVRGLLGVCVPLEHALEPVDRNSGPLGLLGDEPERDLQQRRVIRSQAGLGRDPDQGVPELRHRVDELKSRLVRAPRGHRQVVEQFSGCLEVPRRDKFGEDVVDLPHPSLELALETVVPGPKERAQATLSLLEQALVGHPAKLRLEVGYVTVHAVVTVQRTVEPPKLDVRKQRRDYGPYCSQVTTWQ